MPCLIQGVRGTVGLPCLSCAHSHVHAAPKQLRAILITFFFGLAQATMDWESQDDGYMAKLLVPDGAKDIPVGAPVAVFVEDKVGPTHRISRYVLGLHANLRQMWR
jgi:hypothetical protein